MDEMTFAYDADHVAAGAQRFPAHRQPAPAASPSADLSYLAADDAEFGRHAWDEGGH